MTKSANTSFFKKYRIDIIVVASILLVAVLVLLVSRLMRTDGAFVEIELDGETVGTYPLAIDGVYNLNGGTNTLTIKDGKAFMSYSNCPDHTCENTGKVNYVGQTIVCLPNKLTITVIGESDNSVDFVS